MYIPNELWIGEKEKYDELLDEYFATDAFLEDEENELTLKMIKELKDEPLVLEYLGIF